MPPNGQEVPAVLVHECNLVGKERHRTKYRDAESRAFLAEIRQQYDLWNQENIQLRGPGLSATPQDYGIIERRVESLINYKNFLDAERYAVKFDSRSNLHSSVLEQFVYYLFRDLVTEFGDSALIGKSHTFKDLFFVPPRYSAMIERPHGRIEKKDHDFVIGVSAELVLRTTVAGEAVGGADVDEAAHAVVAPEADPVQDDTAPIQVDEDPVLVRGSEEIHTVDIPAVVIECKTYLDKTMLEGSSRAAEDLKARVPNSLYIVVMERVKLSNAINPAKFKVDQIYVLRRTKNVDREFRLVDGYTENAIDPHVVWHLFQTVRAHLTADWQGGIQHGIERGWLLDTRIDVQGGE